MSSSASQANNTTNANGNAQPEERSTSSYYKAYGGYNNFMHSYGLKPWDDDDVQEGKAIIQAFKDADKEDQAEETKGK